MKHILFILLLFLLSVTAYSSDNSCYTVLPDTSGKYVCTLSEDQVVIRRNKIFGKVMSRLNQIKEVPGGYAFSFNAETKLAKHILEFIEKERECCSFFSFTLHFEPEGGPMWLTVSGDAEVKEILKAELQAAALLPAP